MLKFVAKRHLIHTLAETNTKYVHVVMRICISVLRLSEDQIQLLKILLLVHFECDGCCQFQLTQF